VLPSMEPLPSYSLEIGARSNVYETTAQHASSFDITLLMVRFLALRLTVSSLIAGFAALAAIVTMTFWLNARTQAVFEQVAAARALNSEAVSLRSALQSAESSQRGFLYTQNEIYLAPYNVAKNQARKQLQLLQSGLSEYPNLQAARDRLSEVVDKKLTEIDSTIKLQQQGKKGEALGVVQTNRGKALMDEANIYVSGIVRAADERVLEGVVEQRQNAAQLQLVSILSALAIVAVVGIVTNLVLNYTRSLKTAQEEVISLNVGLEDRVRQRTDDLANTNEQLRHERDRAEALLVEVNHRVANSLTMVSSLVRMQAKSVTDKAAKDALDETRDRINAVALVHRKLYTTGDARFVLLDDYLAGLISDIQSSVHNQQLGISIKSIFAEIKMPIDLSINLGVILNEWVSNAVKYAYPTAKGEIRVELKNVLQDKAQLIVSDDGVGFANPQKALGTGFGTKIVSAMASSLSGDIEFKSGSPGTIATLTFSLKKIAD
jgi:two-component sensor histidine kinase/CHASE3 domain sensor protein